MTWKAIQPLLLATKSREACYQIALASCQKSIQFSTNTFVRDTLNMIEAGLSKKDVEARFQQIASIRKLEQDDLKAREAAHIVLHTIELLASNSYQSAAAHAARCLEALARFDQEAAQTILASAERSL